MQFPRPPTTPVFPTLIATLALVAATALPASADAAPITRWRYFTAPGSDIRMQVPTNVNRSHRVTSTIVGDINTDVWSSRSAKGTFTVSMTYLPRIAVLFSSDDSIYDRSAQTMVDEMGAELLSIRDFDEGLFAREIRFLIPARDGLKTRLGRARFVLQDKTVVMVTAIVPADEARRLDGFYRYVLPVRG